MIHTFKPVYEPYSTIQYECICGHVVIEDCSETPQDDRLNRLQAQLEQVNHILSEHVLREFVTFPEGFPSP